MNKARLHPIWVGGRAGYLYSVIYAGELLVERSRDPECDAARALLAQGITGKLTLLDGKTGIPRTTINIEKAAQLTVSEENRDGLRFRPYRIRISRPTAPKRVRLIRRPPKHLDSFSPLGRSLHHLPRRHDDKRKIPGCESYAGSPSLETYVARRE